MLKLFVSEFLHVRGRLSETIYQYSKIIFWTISVIVISTLIYTLDKGLIFSDEAWYLLHLNPDIQLIKSSFWCDYSALFLPNNLLALRISIVSLLVTSSLIFSIGFGNYVKMKIYEIIWPISIFSIFILWAPVSLVSSYITLNMFLFFSGLGLFLWAVSDSNPSFSYLLAITSGIIFSQLIFVMITNTPFIFLILIPGTFILSRNRTRSLKLCGAIIFGIILGIILFFLFITPINQFLADFKSASKIIQNDDSSHGIIPMIKWTLRTMLYFLNTIIVPASILLVLISGEKIDRKLKVALGISLFAYVMFLVIYDFVFEHLNIIAPTPFIIIALAIIAKMFFLKNNSEAFLGIVFLSVTFFASLGTNVEFPIRASLYIMPIIVYICYSTFKNKEVLTLALIVFLLIISTLRFSIEFIRKPGWYEYVISQQTENIKGQRYAQNIKLDIQRVSELNELKSIISPKSQILVSSSSLWGFVYLLDCQTPILYYNYNDPLVTAFIKGKDFRPNELFLLESKHEPFPETMYLGQPYSVFDTILLNTNNDLILYRNRIKPYE